MQAVINHKEDIFSPRIKAIPPKAEAPISPIKIQIIKLRKFLFIFVVFSCYKKIILFTSENSLEFKLTILMRRCVINGIS